MYVFMYVCNVMLWYGMLWYVMLWYVMVCMYVYAALLLQKFNMVKSQLAAQPLEIRSGFALREGRSKWWTWSTCKDLYRLIRV